jgi:dipeptidyl-peptidase-3
MTQKQNYLSALAIATLLLGSCGQKTAESSNTTEISTADSLTQVPADTFRFITEQFADIKIQRYQVPGFETLSAKQKELVYYLYEAALSGRDMIYDQNFKHNLRIRRTLEGILEHYTGDRNSADFKQFLTYAKRVWFSNGIHHHYSNNKFVPEFSQAYFAQLIKNSSKAKFPLQKGESMDQFISFLSPILFDAKVAAKRVNLDEGDDLLKTSANNYYEGVSQPEAEAFYAKLIDKNNPRPVSYGLNSKLTKENGKIVEKVWKVGGMYGPAISKIVYWLEKASAVAENEKQKLALDKLIQYYKTGDLKTFDEYSIAWVNDTDSRVDVVNGFIEVYGDPLGYRGAYESVVSIRDLEASKRIKAIGDQAQWFEDNSPIQAEHKKKNVTGISAKVITAVVEAGDAAPSTPIGINLPNANWIRKEHGSKSVNLGNIVYAYNQANSKGSALTEFAFSEAEVARSRKYGPLAGDLHTDMHEVIGHASGQINAGVGTPKQTMKSYASAIEEGRADLVALYFLLDPKMVELGIIPSLEVGKAEYDTYIRNGLITQLARLAPGENIEEAHMRNRQMVAKWAYEKGKADNVIEKVSREGKTYFKINDYEKLRGLFGQLLRETQRVTSEGDLAGAKHLIETYGVKVDQALHKEVLARYAKLNIAPYSGFIQPKLSPVVSDGKITDVKVSYPVDFVKQMLEYGKQYSFLPDYN